MSNLSWLQLANAQTTSQTAIGTALANSTTLTDISAGANTAGQAFAFGASQLQVGQAYLIKANGIVSTTGTPNLTLGVYYGAVAGTALATTGALATASGLSNATWDLELLLRVDAAGTSGSIRSIGRVIGINGTQMLPATSSSSNNVTVNTSTSNPLTIGALWGTAAAGNTITCAQLDVIYLTQGIS